ncbi:MAG: TMEM43 family protein [Akkermansiaceae bacterium]|nr:TMEM43 family protein [Akkermansiaceae bacterium]
MSKKTSPEAAGICLISIGVLCLWYNEGRFDYSRAAKLTRKTERLEEIKPDESVSYTGKLQECVIDGKYVDSIKGYYRVRGITEIYCWRRSEDSDGKVKWEKDWLSSLQKNDRNQQLSQSLRQFSRTPSEYQLDELSIPPASLHFADDQVEIHPDGLVLNEAGDALGLQAEGSYFYIRKLSVQEEQLGDERIRFEGIPSHEIATYFGLVNDSTAQPKYHEVTGDLKFISNLVKDDGILYHLVNGERNEALRTIKSHFITLKWKVRLIASGAVIWGFYLFFSQLLQLIAALPLIGNLIRGGTLLVSLVLGTVISVLTITSSLVYHKPVTALLSVGIAVGILGFSFWRSKKGKANARKNLQVREESTGSDEVSVTDRQHQADGWSRATSSFANLVRLSLMDGTVDRKENDFLVRWAKAKGLTDQVIAEIFERAKHENDDGLERAEMEDLYYLVSLGLVDGHLAAKELKHIIRFGEKCGATRQQVNSMIKSVQKGSKEWNVAQSAA